jgi:putative transposase
VKLTYQYRLYPTNEQATLFTQWLTTCRLLYNTSLAERRAAWTTAHRSVTYTEQATHLKAAKTTTPYVSAVHLQVLQDVLRRLDKTFKNFFKRVKNGEKAGYPRFKGRNRYDSFTYPQSGFALDATKKKLVLSKIGEVNIKYHRPIPADGVIKTCTIKRDVDHWYACFTVELPERHPLPPSDITTAIGVDVGLTHLLALNNGEMIENPRWLRSSEKNWQKSNENFHGKRRGRITATGSGLRWHGFTGRSAISGRISITR